MTTKEMEERLDKLYYANPKLYLQSLDNVKKSGYKVYRNSKGQHKVKMDYYSFFDMFR
jgi:hypothetical protein